MNETRVEQKTAQKEIKPLTFFRFAAALAVFLCHLSFFQGDPALAPIYNNFFVEGGVGVVFFFILSGFILTYNYHAQISSFSPRALSSFFVSRFARIYPVHCLAFLASLPLVIPHLSEDLIATGTAVLLNLALLQSFFPYSGFYFSFNVVSWSLSDEVFFYLLFPLILILLLRAVSTQRKRALILALGAWIAAAVFAGHFQDGSNLALWMVYYSPYFQLANFVIGMLLAFLFMELENIRLTPRVFSLLEVGALAAVTLALFLHPIIPSALRLSVYYTPFFSLVILVFAFQKGVLSRIFSDRVLVHLGEISFSFYMFHRLIISYFTTYEWLKDSPLVCALVTFVISLGVSLLCFRFYEFPLRFILRQKIKLDTWSAVRPPERPDQIANVTHHDESATEQTRASRRNRDNIDSPGSDLRWALGASKKLLGGAVLVIVAVVGATYYPSLSLGFLGTIWNHLEAAVRLTPFQNVLRIIDPRAHIIDYRPAQDTIILFLNTGLGFDATRYRLERIWVHLADILLLFGIILVCVKNLRVALGSALLVGTLSFYAQTVFDLTDPLPEAGLFGLLSIVLWLCFLQTSQMRYYLLTLGAFICALLTEQVFAALPLLLILLEARLDRKNASYSQSFRRYLPFLFLLCCFVLIRFMISQEPRDLLFAVWLPIAIAFLVLWAFRQYVAALVYLACGAVLAIGSFWSTHGEDLLTEHPTDLIAIILLVGIWLSQRWHRFDRMKLFQGVMAILIGGVLFVNTQNVSQAALDLREIIRQRRVPLRDITLQHPTFPKDTLLYFVEPPFFRDLSGNILMRYGKDVSVGSSANDSLVHGILYSTPARLNAFEPAGSSGAHQIAGLRDHALSLVYYFDATGRPVEMSVDRNRVSRPVPDLPAQFGPIRLEGFELTSNVLKPGDPFVLLLYWRATTKVSENYTVFVHLVDRNGKIVDGYDSQPRQGKFPTTLWEPKQLEVDPVVYTIPTDVPAGTYKLEIGLYDLATLERLLIVDPQGQPIADQVVIEPIDLR